MAFRLKAKDGSVTKAVRRIAREQIGRAIDAIEDESPAQAVHDLRKRCKKLRGLIRLVRPAFPDYAEENAFFRDTARMVGELRDAKVMQDTYDGLVGKYEGQFDRKELDAIRRRLTHRHKIMQREKDVEAALEQCRSRLRDARRRCAEWKLGEEGWDAISGGLSKTYARARHAATRAELSGDPADFHELRKRVKYHWHHCRILRPICPDELKSRAALARKLSDELGDHHDLSVFTAKLAEAPGDFGNDRDVDLILTLARRRSAMLAQRASVLSARLLAEDAQALVDRFGDSWTGWEKRDGFGR
ncbi:CHAD domain-containing protein [Altererythrobacter atlanticus]|uniref:CHAD domain protein n=1 Tax=Croceibacterium atlanticum TaxID=1267766 RepID=A0A0F7KSV5_9SPHN|nr:CHAD domain-containing protein [Croceibacterium atlanticum]AKH42221.1 CHAD domain protein [Croceibacterium atlanticum]MBB5733966.1 CHAD domain-containing protein [Croceibacterium atlanticum]